MFISILYLGILKTLRDKCVGECGSVMHLDGIL